MLTASPFLELHIDTVAVAGAALWSLALYLGFSPIGEWVAELLNRGLSVVMRSPSASDISANALNPTRQDRESQIGLYASLFSVIPFLAVGVFCNYGVELGLGRSWSISVGIIACVGCGVYELGRRSG